MAALTFDSLARALGALPTRRRLLGLLAGSGLASSTGLPGSSAKKRKKRACGPCAKRKRGKCRAKADGLTCDTGKVCRQGKCECQQACPDDRECLANGSCGRRCPADFMCGEGCGCSLPSVEGPSYCIGSEGGCETFTQGCQSTAECPTGQVCLTTFCASAPFQRCFSLCPS